MIKIKHRKTLEVNKVTSGIPNRDVIQVADAELVLMESSGEGNSILVNQLWVRPVLISKTEKIEVGDKVYSLDEPEYGVFTWDENCPLVCFKILALPEHFSPETLKDIVDGKLKDGDKILDECEQFTENTQSLIKDWKRAYRVKLNPSNYITIYPVEDKMYTEEEVYCIVHDFATAFVGNTSLDPEEWLYQNVKRY